MKTNTIGRLTCPICGEPLQDIRVNKNGNLYMFCDNQCSVRFSPVFSKKYLPVLMAGHSAQIEKIGVITSIKEKEQKQNVEWKQPTNTGTNAGGADFNRRTDGQNTGVLPSGRPKLGRFIAGLLDDDDE